MGCSNLFSVTLPECLETIEEYAFYGCTNLTEIYLHSTTPPTTEVNCFWINATGGNLYDQATLYVPTGCKDVYSAHPVWGQFYNIIVATPPVYQLIYMVDGEVHKIYEVEYGNNITPESEPVKEGYTFSGWSEIPETMPAYDVTITGSYTFINGILDITAEDGNRQFYTPNGKRVNTLQKGVNIIRIGDGTVRKVLVK